MHNFKEEDFKILLKNLSLDSETSLIAELCGLVGVDEVNNKLIYQKMKNRAQTPENYFMIDPYDYLSFIKKYKLLLIFHSHLLGDESPSEFDLKTSENSCVPFLIYSICTEKFSLYEPQYKDYDVNIIEGLRNLI